MSVGGRVIGETLNRDSIFLHKSKEKTSKINKRVGTLIW